MHIRNLTIRNSAGVIRSISFRAGLNLIADQTPATERQESGSSVGKTTVLRLIDFCLGGNAQPLFLDRESRQENEAVANFARNQKASVELTLQSQTGLVTKIVRYLDEKKQSVDGEDLSLTKFRARLGQRLFGLSGTSKPTLRQLVPKFVRVDTHRMDNTLQWLHANTSHADYEPVWAFMFGLTKTDLLDTRLGYKKGLKGLKQELAHMGKRISPGALRVIIAQWVKQIEEHETAIAHCDVTPVLDDEVVGLSHLREEISQMNEHRVLLWAKVEALNRARDEFGANRSSVSPKFLRKFYKDAIGGVGSLSKSFEELQKFHNNMTDSRISFIDSTIEDVMKDFEILSGKLQSLTAREATLLRAVRSRGALVDLEKMYGALSDLRERKAQDETRLASYESVFEEKKRLETALADSEAELGLEWEAVLERVDVFNEVFSHLTKDFFGEMCVLVPEMVEEGEAKRIKLSVRNVMVNQGTGQKRAEIAAFDMSYVAMLDAVGNEIFPRFVVHDQVENIHLNQLCSIFGTAESYGRRFGGQYIVAVLWDRVEGIVKEFPEDIVRLRLSRSDRLFQLPG